MKIVKLSISQNAKFRAGVYGLMTSDVIIHSDTLASAIINNYVKTYGDKQLDNFIRHFPKISSVLPRINITRNGIKKEIILFPSPVKLKNKVADHTKVLKKVKFISEKELINIPTITDEHLYGDNCLVAGETIFSNDEIKELSNIIDIKKFKIFNTNIEQKLNTQEEQPSPFSVKFFSPFAYSNKAGKIEVNMYFLVDANEVSEEFKHSVELLKVFGLGGKKNVISRQINNIEIYDYNLPTAEKYGKWMSVGLYNPLYSEIKSAQYKLMLRGGFIEGLPLNMRKKEIYMITEGSLISQKPLREDKFIDVSPIDNYKIYKFINPIFIKI